MGHRFVNAGLHGIGMCRDIPSCSKPKIIATPHWACHLPNIPQRLCLSQDTAQLMPILVKLRGRQGVHMREPSQCVCSKRGREREREREGDREREAWSAHEGAVVMCVQ